MGAVGGQRLLGVSTDSVAVCAPGKGGQAGDRPIQGVCFSVQLLELWHSDLRALHGADRGKLLSDH